MGRKKKPDALKKIQGTDRLDRMNPEQPEYPLIKTAEPPEHLTDEEKQVWVEIVPQFIESGIFTQIDVQPICMMCAELAEYWKYHKASKNLKPEDPTELKQIWTLKTLQQMKFKSASKIMMQFGMSPVARQSLRVAPGSGNDPMQNALPPKPKIEI